MENVSVYERVRRSNRGRRGNRVPRDHRVASSLCNIRATLNDTSSGFNRVSYLNVRYISSTMSLRIRFLATDACIV